MKNSLVKYLSVFVVFAFAKAELLQAQQFSPDTNFQYAVDACVAKSQVATPSTQGVLAATGNYDVKYVRLELDTDPSVAFISGTVTTHFEAKTNLNSMILELASNMQVNSVTQRGQPLSFTHNSQDELLINLSQQQLAGQLDSLSVSYSGNPISSGFGSFAQTTHAGAPIIWTLSEPYGAKAWWPCKQDLNDKIDEIDVYIDTPLGNTGVSNGILQSEITITNGKRFHWKHTYPIPAYLIAIAVTNYTKYTDVVPGAQPLDIDNYVYPENLATAQSQTAITIPMMQFFENQFGPYPFRTEKYGHAQFGWGGGMEHTTISFMGNFNQGLIAHELAHQWFGNKVTCGSWQDIWLNESFATYATGMTVEHLNGANSFKNWRVNANNSATAQTSQSVYVPAADTLNVARVFSSRMSYNKGAMVLHMLRRKVSNSSFIQGLQQYLNDPNLAFDYALTTDFKTIIEQESGQNLTAFFNDWIYGEGYPSHQVAWRMSGSNTLLIEATQTQSHPSVSFFEGEVPIKVYGTQAGQEQEILLNIQNNGQAFNFNVPFIVVQVDVDPDVHTISKNNSTSTLTIEEQRADAEISIYPNPTSDFIFIESSQNTIQHLRLYDIAGRLISQQNVIPQQTHPLEMNLPQINGLYILEIKTGNGLFVKKIVKY